MENEVFIKAENLSYAYEEDDGTPQKAVLRGVSLEVKKGEYVAILGHNGSGKSTTEKLICGHLVPDGGEIKLFGRDYTDPGVRVRVGALIENAGCFPGSSVYQNLMMQCINLGIENADEEIRRVLEIVRMEDNANIKFKSCSLGMKQRLGIAIALAGDPDFLVLDEPVNGLDPQGIVEMRELILKLNRERQITVLISSHILDELSRLATHYGIIDNGRMVKELSAEELDAACRKCVRMEVTDTAVLARVLDSMNLEYKIISATTADVYAKVNVTQLAVALAKENCEVLSMQEKDESLESYYISLVGGGSNV